MSELLENEILPVTQMSFFKAEKLALAMHSKGGTKPVSQPVAVRFELLQMTVRMVSRVACILVFCPTVNMFLQASFE